MKTSNITFTSFPFSLHSLTVATAISAASLLGNLNSPVEMQQNAIVLRFMAEAASMQER